MKNFFKVLGIVLLVALVVIQFFPKNYPENVPPDENDIIAAHDVPDDIGVLLKASCYDCHSNQIKYPWYSYVAPASFLISHDIDEGRSELNFSEWGTYDTKRRLKKLDEMVEEVEEGKMPLPIYLTLHGDARLSEDQVAQLEEWAHGLMNDMLGE